LMTDLVGAYDEAAELGLTALRRSPGQLQLANNTAYALSLAGRTDEALRVLAGLDDLSESVAVTATRALAEWAGGDPAKGIEGYRKARGLAEQRGDLALAALVDLNAVIAARQFGYPGDAPREPLLAELNTDWFERSDFWIAGQRFKREMGMEIGTLAGGSGGTT
jgi:hypothetical protein